MPFRFRRIIPLGKGFRINLSKSGISSSIGGKGFTVNFSKRGVRPTISAPGTGISYTPSMASSSSTSPKLKVSPHLFPIENSAPNPAANKISQKSIKSCLLGFGSLILICIIFVCLFGLIFSDTDLLITPTPMANIPIETIIQETYSASRAQTLSVSTLIPPPATFTPVDLPPTILYPVTVYPATSAPTWTPIPTFTLFVLNTPTFGSPSIVCSCSGDLYNCSDFSTHSQAQSCFDYCISQGRGDIHKLDQDNDSNVCESLP